MVVAIDKTGEDELATSLYDASAFGYMDGATFANCTDTLTIDEDVCMVIANNF